MGGLKNLVLGIGLLTAACDEGETPDQGAASVDELEAVAEHVKKVRNSTGSTVERAGFDWDSAEPANYGNLHPKFTVVEPDAGVVESPEVGVDSGMAGDASLDAEPDSGGSSRSDERYVIQIDPQTDPFSFDGVKITAGTEKIDCRAVAFPSSQNQGLEAYSCLISEPVIGEEYPVEGVLVISQRELLRMQLVEFPKGLPSEKILIESLDITSDGCQDRIKSLSVSPDKCEALFHELVDAIKGLVELQPTPEMKMAYEYYKNLLDVVKSFSTGSEKQPNDNKFFTKEPAAQDEQLGPVITMPNGDKMQCSVDERYLSNGRDSNGDITGEWKIVQLNCFIQNGDDLFYIKMKFANVTGEDAGIYMEVSKNSSLAASMDVTGQQCSFRLDNGTPLPTFASVKGVSPCADLLSKFRHFTSEVSRVPRAQTK